MSDADFHRQMAPQLRVLQAVVGAMVLGVSMLLAVAMALRAGGALPPPVVQVPLLSWVAGVVAAGTLIARAVVPGKVAAAMLKKLTPQVTHPDPTGRGPLHGEEITGLVRVLVTKTIVSAALVEGPALFAGIAYLIEGSGLALILTILLLLGLAYHFPTRSRLEDWVDAELRRLETDQVYEV